MKTKFLLSLLILLFVKMLSAQTSGGPDNYGYTWKNESDANGPAYKWKNIKGIGTKITGLGDDNQAGPFNLNWNFHYYWSNYDKVWVGSNGWVGFQNIGNIASAFPSIPDPSAPNNYIAPLMCDFTFTQTNSSGVPGATAWYWSNNKDSLIIQYDSVPYYAKTAPQEYSGRYTFQVILSGHDSSITYQYEYAKAGTTPYSMTQEGLTTGIENSTGQIGLQVLAYAFPTPNTAVKFYYPHPDTTYHAFDAAPAWNKNTENGGFFVSANSAPLKMTTNIANVGNQPIDTIPVTGEVFDATVTPVWNSSYTVSALAVGKDTTLTYPAAYTPSVTGSFFYRTTTKLNNDINIANDIMDVEMVTVDTTKADIELSYVTSPTSSTQPSGWGGNGGQGIYIEPPFYPATLTSADFFVARSGPVGNHLIQILDDNGPGHTPGTLLYSAPIAASTAVQGAYNNVPVTTPVVITSGGVYVSWMENGDTLSAIGTDDVIPLSNRNYEILGGAWASYRNNAVNDLMIRVHINAFGAVTTSMTPDGCPSNGTGTATANVAGGTAPFTYSWSTSPVQTTATATGLTAGVYTVTVTNSQGSTSTATAFISSNTTTVSIASSTPATCYGGSNGSATASISGTGPFTYVWGPGGQTTAIATGLSAGTYSVVATNAAGCFNMASVTITSPSMISVSSSTNVAGCLNNNGIAITSVTGGTPGYTYSWSTSPAQTTATATGLSAGNYTLTVTDAAGCTNASLVNVTNSPFTISVTKTAISCNGANNGSATATPVSGGIAPYSYVWSTTPVQTTATITGLSPANYTVLVTESQGCTKSGTAVIANPAVLTVTVNPSPGTCSTCTDGGAVSTSTGGTSPYKYAWAPGGQTTKNATGLVPGNYTVCVTDSKGCTTCATATVGVNGIHEIYDGASVVVSPNPFSSSALVKIDFVNPSHNNLLFILFDIYGREIQSIDLREYKGSSIDFTLNRGFNVPQGMYFYRLEDGKDILSTGKLVVQ